ncbi:MAG: MFS transporter, partial [Acidimicrobiales bacterium]
GRRGHNRGVGVFQAATGVGAAAGPLVGGPLVLFWGWPAVFWFRVPICVALLVLARSIGPTTQRTRASSDVAGAVLVTLGLTAGLLAVNSGRTFGFASPLVAIATVVTVAVGAIYVARARTHPAPILDPSLFSVRRFSIANLLTVLANGAMFVAWLLVPAMLVTELGRPAVVSGIALAASPIAMGAFAPLAGRWSDRSGYRAPIATGLVLEAIGLAWLATASPGTSTVAVTLAMATTGAGLGLFGVPNMAMVMSTLPHTEQGAAGGLSLVMRTAGIVIGVSGSAALFDHLQQTVGFFDAYRSTTLTSAAVAAIAAALAMADGLARSPARPAVA